MSGAPHPARVYVLYSALVNLGMGFICVTYVPWLLRLGFGMGEIALANVACFTATTLAELPTGMFADGRSRSWSVRMGLVLLSVSFLGYGLARGVWSALACELVCGLATAFISGADQAWLTDALAHRQEKEALARTLGTSAAVNAAVMLAGGFVGGWLAIIDPRLSWFCGAASQFSAFLVCRSWMRQQGEPRQRISETEAFRRSFRAMRTERFLRWTAAASVIYGLTLPFNHYWIPLFRIRASQASLSWLWLVAYGSLMAAGWTVRKRAAWRDQETGGVTVALLLAGLGMAVATFVPGVIGPLAFVMIHEFGRGAFSPLLSSLTQRHAESPYRATYGSFQSLVARGGYVIVELMIWLSLDGAELTESAIGVTWAISGGTLILSAVGLWLLRPRLA